MNDYVELKLTISPASTDASDVMAALLADTGFESFVPDHQGLTAYIRSELYDRPAVTDIVNAFPMGSAVITSEELIPGRDWNKEWEQNFFKPIVVGDQCVIHSSFHTDFPQVPYDIVIDPKMAFGTGHHATTSQVIEAILSMDLNGCSVIDMGTGTGILAILCALRGAKEATGIEIDPMAWENAVENIALNHVDTTVKLICGDASALEGIAKANLFIANINRNIITADLKRYVEALKPGGTMLLSGFYEHDIPVIMQTATPLGLVEESHTTKDDWACLKLRY